MVPRRFVRILIIERINPTQNVVRRLNIMHGNEILTLGLQEPVLRDTTTLQRLLP